MIIFLPNQVWIWSISKFYNRKDLMDELYLKWLDGDSVILSRDKDPFWDPVEEIFAKVPVLGAVARALQHKLRAPQ